MDLLPQVLIPLLIIGGFVYLLIRRNRERAGNAPLRGEIEARVCFETTLDRASILGTGGFGGTRGVWIRLRGPKRLIVGADAFMVSAPQALRDFVFRGSESTIAFGQAVNPDDCIMITGQAGGRQVQLAITGDNLPDIWRALAATGAALMLRVVNSESSGACWKSATMEYLSIRRAAGPGLSRRQAEDLFKAASGGATLQQLRQSALTHDTEAGASTPMLMSKSGHTSVALLARYARPSAEALSWWQERNDPARRR
jgi:hypothetical protein